VLALAVEAANSTLAEAGITLIGHITFHSLRCTYASMRCACGNDVRYTADQLGHEDPRFTLRVYAQATFPPIDDLSAKTTSQRNYDASIAARHRVRIEYCAFCHHGVEQGPALKASNAGASRACSIEIEQNTRRSAVGLEWDQRVSPICL
jgi:hypothetical protein